MTSEAGWRPLRPPAGRAGGAIAMSPFSRLALAHALAVSGDALLTLALAGSLFFSISPTAAKGRVTLYLALTMAPFAVVAPLLGPVLDRSRGGRRLVIVVTASGRALLCLLMASDLKSYLLFPEAFSFLVLSKAYAITKSALVPSTVVDHDELVEANAKLQLLGAAVGVLAAAPGVVVLRTVGAPWVLRLAAVVFGAATVAALRIARATRPATEPLAEHRAELRTAGIVLAASAMGLLRAMVGFLTFLVAFGFRHGHAPSWWFGVVLAATMGGTLLGAAVAPRLRQSVPEEKILIGALAGMVVVGLVSARGGDVRPWAAVMGGAMGFTAAVGKLAFDSLVQRDAPDAARGRSFARFETRFQLLWVAGSFAPVLVPIPMRVGFVVIAAVLGFAVFTYVGGRRAAARHRRHVPSAPASAES